MHELTSAAVALMVCVAAGSYLAGCCNGAIITSFLFYHDDIRKHGSHNAGLTNFYRVYGGKFAVCVILIDMLKAFVAVKLGSIVFGEYLGLRLEGEYFSALFCVIGHIFPAFYSFKGGKGILCSGTLLLLLDWRIAAVGWGLFLLLWLTTRYVSRVRSASRSRRCSFSAATGRSLPSRSPSRRWSSGRTAPTSAGCCTARNPASSGTPTAPAAAEE